MKEVTVQDPNPRVVAQPNTTETVTMFFPQVVHLRRQDQSLLKFAIGPNQVPADLLPAELEILKRNGVKPIGQVPKEVIAASEVAAKAPLDGSETARTNAINAKAQAQSGEESPELANEIAIANAMLPGPAKEAALATIAAKQKAAKDTKASLDAAEAERVKVESAKTKTRTTAEDTAKSTQAAKDAEAARLKAEAEANAKKTT